MLWFEKNYPDALYMDKTPRSKRSSSHRPNWCCVPDIVADFRKMPFQENTFDLVVFDPPHANISLTSQIGIEYGSLNGLAEVRDGFHECMRVVRPRGVVIFKWADVKYSVREVLDAIDYLPLFGHTTGKSGKTKWLCFIKENDLEKPTLTKSIDDYIKNGGS